MMELEALAEKIEALIVTTESQLTELSQHADNFVRNITPAKMQDQNGRFILLDAYAAYGQVRAALAMQEASDSQTVAKLAPHVHPPHTDDDLSGGLVLVELWQHDLRWLRDYLARTIVLSDRGEHRQDIMNKATRIVNGIDRVVRPR
jgi:hypothetical protein